MTLFCFVSIIRKLRLFPHKPNKISHSYNTINNLLVGAKLNNSSLVSDRVSSNLRAKSIPSNHSTLQYVSDIRRNI